MNNVITDILNQINNTNWLEFMSVMVNLCEWDMMYNRSLSSNSEIKGFHLIKDKLKSENIKEVELPPELTSYYRGIDFRYIMSYKFGETISEFTQLMLNHFPSQNLIMLYNNINELKVEGISINKRENRLKSYLNKKRPKLVAVGEYNCNLNRIRVIEKVSEIYLPHELFHMSTNFVDQDNEIVYNGFRQSKFETNESIGEGLNEGYTEYMVAKYYGSDRLSSNPQYALLTGIVANIENVIGKDKMENFYLTANLKGLVDELTKYIGYDETMKFISSTDYLYKNVNHSKKSKKEKEVLLEQLKFVNNFMIMLGANKAIKQLIDEEIEPKDLGTAIGGLRTFSMNLRNEKYDASLSKEQYKNIICYLLDKNGIELEFNVESKENNGISLNIGDEKKQTGGMKR